MADKKETPARVQAVRFGMAGYQETQVGLTVILEMFGERTFCNYTFYGTDALEVVRETGCKDINDLVGQMCVVTNVKLGEKAEFVRWWK